jgi:hypothetical protein
MELTETKDCVISLPPLFFEETSARGRVRAGWTLHTSDSQTGKIYERRTHWYSFAI